MSLTLTKVVFEFNVYRLGENKLPGLTLTKVVFESPN